MTSCSTSQAWGTEFLAERDEFAVPKTSEVVGRGSSKRGGLTPRFWFLLAVLAVVILAAALATSSGFIGSGAVQATERRAVDLDAYIKSQRPLQTGTRSIFAPRDISFSAKPKSRPEPIEVSYLYEALSIMGVDPLPEVSHQMFVESVGGQVIAVYVEDRFVDAINAEIESEALAEFDGYHVYNYSKGPAIVVVGVSQ